MKHILKISLAAAAILFGLAGAAMADEFDDADPFEPVNRAIFAFNEGADYIILTPAAEVYNYVLPQYVRNRLHNAFTNLREPWSAVNYVLQGDLDNAGEAFLRFLGNSSFGLLGFYDAVGGQNEENIADFGQTLGVWGVGNGPYLVLPFLGPSVVRDSVGLVAQAYGDPVAIGLRSTNFDEDGNTYFGLKIATALDARARLIDQIEDLRKNSLDFYAATRSIYLQRRLAKVSGNENGASSPEIPVYGTDEN